jgi:ketosteroid isomerase-like protein
LYRAISELVEWPVNFSGGNVIRTKSATEKVAEQIAELDKRYQAAVKRNDAEEMDRILTDDFVLVTGSGKSYTKADLLEEARSGRIQYEQQVDSDQTVRVWGDTAAVTAKLWAKGLEDGRPFEYHVWFTDTYIRTPAGWRYVLGQSGGRLP